ncbi:MAG: DUF1360 domain-containing protein [Candidatus Thorarchaeota archaeon]|jgi:hypothetical protein
MATWRLASLLVNERGPFDIFMRIRELTGIEHDVEDDFFPWSIPDTFFGNLFGCVWCMSVWVALFLYAVWYFSPMFAIMISTPLALSSLAILLDTHITK